MGVGVVRMPSIGNGAFAREIKSVHKHFGRHSSLTISSYHISNW